MNMNVAVVGNGGREHEIGRQLDNVDEVGTVFMINGNAGTSDFRKGVNYDIDPTAIDDLVGFASDMQFDLTIIGPETPLVMGAADRLRAQGLTVFGPSAEAAKLEGSKAYATEFMQAYDIPHPPATITSSYISALSVVRGRDASGYVIKADGLAGGKGVILPKSYQEAERTLYSMFEEGAYDGAGKEKVIIQDRFHGPEVSVFVISDGERFTILPYAQDHKRLLTGDHGPNTGGMGAYTPLPPHIVNRAQEEKIQDIAERSIAGMKHRGVPYQGALYIGLMMAEELGGDPVVIEYNARFGDPETQVVLPALSNAGVDVFDLLMSTAEGHLNEKIRIPSNLGSAALTVCLAARGYPEKPEKGQTIFGLEGYYGGVILQHAGTVRNGHTVESAGGRVMYVTGVGKNVDEAATLAYRAIGPVAFDGMQFRTDIGHQARSRNE